jgi:hypothetical protein
MARADPTARAGDRCMRLFGFLLLLAGWAIVLSALALLAADAPRVAFALAGMGVEIVGLVVVIRAHPVRRGAQE